MRFARLIFVVALALAARVSFAADTDTDSKPARELYERVSPSLVVVQYTYDGELGRRDLDGAGLVIGDDGTVTCSIAITPAQLPDEHLKNFKIIIPGGLNSDEVELDATFLGRDERSNLAFVRAKDASKHKWAAVKFEDVKSDVGDVVMSVGLMPKAAGYKTYLVMSHVAAHMRGPTPQVLVGGEGLAAIGSPVFNADGKAIGLVEIQPDQNPVLNDPRNPLGSIMNPPRTFVPTADFLPSLSDLPSEGKPLAVPWTGVSQLTGLKKDVAEYYGLKDVPAVQIGDVIPGAPADKAGVKGGDVITKFNGQPLERGDQPEETWRILSRKISRLKPGTEITLTLMSGKDQPPRDVKVTLAERPKNAARAKRFFAEDLGFSVRDLVFDDTYERKLPQDTPGVMVAFVKPGSSAQSARLAIGDLISQLNGQPVKNVDDFKEQYDAFRKDKPKEALVLEVMRGVNTQVIRIEPPQ